MNDAINKLPGDLQEIAEIIGLENMMKLVEQFGGTYIKIPKCEGVIRQIRDNKIRELYDTDKYTIRDLALKFKLTDRRISDILSKIDEDIPEPIFDLFSQKFSI